MSYLEELLPEFRKGTKIRFSSWEEGDYICVKNGEVFDEQGRKIFNIGSALTLLDKWELYQEPIDWDYIIKNKCLCYFWDEDDNFFMIGILLKISKPYDQFRDYKYKDKNGRYWENCRPVRKYEVTFYEDRKDE